jgi:predicted NBD/HSP70 family sugar kinase
MAEIDGGRLLRPTQNTREQSRQRILQEVMIQPATQTRLSQLTGLSPATVSTIVKELQEEEIIYSEATGGERARRVRLGPVHGAAVGVDLGYTHVTVMVRRLDRDEERSQIAKVGSDQGTRTWVSQAARLVKDELGNVGLGLGDVVSIGMGAPGGVDPRTGELTQAALTFGWENEPAPHRLLGETLGLSIAGDNDANMGALGEYLYGEGRDAETFVYVKAATGVGAGLVIGGLVTRGRRGIAMELGHITVEPDGIVCPCGKRGCLLTVVGGNYLVEQARQSKVGFRGASPTDLDALIERARTGDRACLRIIEDAGRRLGFGLGQVSSLIDPDVIAIGGKLASAYDLMKTAMLQSFASFKLSSQSGAREPQVVQTALGHEAQVRGALALGVRSNHSGQPV